MTAFGRIVAVLVMFAGVGIIGSLASILARILVPSAAEVAAADDTPGSEAGALALDPTLREEMTALRAEIAALRRALPRPSQDGQSA